MAVYCGLDYYDKDILNKLLNDNRVDGVVLGDLFCYHRMFEYGESSFYEMVNIVINSKKKLIYQAPMYITPRNEQRVYDMIRYLSAVSTDNFVITQDIGLISFINRRCSRINIVWSRMGRSREYKFNSLYIKTLYELGVRYFETDNLELIKLIEAYPVELWYLYGNINYSTLGRCCYIKYQLGIDETECNGICREEKYRMVLKENTDFEMTINGYFMGKNLSYSNSIAQMYKNFSEKNYVLYAKNYTEFEEKISELKGI